MKSLYLSFILFTSFNSDFYQEKKFNRYSFSEQQNYALFFAVNDYDSMRPLSNPIADAKAIAQELERTYNFTTEVVENPTIDEIESKLKLYANRFASNESDQNGQLFIYFSGHGVVDNQNGFFLAKDSNPDKLSRTAFPYEYWRPFINNISCKHILVAIDACFSGTFDPNWWSRNGGRFERPGELSDSEKLIANHAQYTTRLFFTSATETESPDQSNFARKLLEGLHSGGGADNILTSTELFAYVELANPKPHRGEFGKNEAGSSFLFIPNNPIEFVSDPAGRKYKTVQINGKTWLAENLAYDLGSDCWCYNDSIDYCNQFGRLYTWQSAKIACTVLGAGWRLPKDSEWRDLINTYGGYLDDFKTTLNDLPIDKHPSKSSNYSKSFTDLTEGGISGFNANFGGTRGNDGSIPFFPDTVVYLDKLSYGYYWSSTAYDDSEYQLKLHDKNDKVLRYSISTTRGGFYTYTLPARSDSSFTHDLLIDRGPIIVGFEKEASQIVRTFGRPYNALSCRCIK